MPQPPDSSLAARATLARRLDARITAAGLLQPTPRRYLSLIVLTWLAAAAAAGALVAADSAGGQLAAAIGLGLLLVQIGAIGHDADHGQICRSPLSNRRLAAWHWNLGTGISQSWWHDKHLRHHRHTNIPGLDADFYPILTYSRVEAAQARGLKRAIARWEAWWYPLLLVSTRLYFQLLSLRFIYRATPRAQAEGCAILAHHGAVALLHVSAGGPGWGVTLLLVGYAASGLYMGYVFSPNHIGMPLVSARPKRHSAPVDERISHALATTRNVATTRPGDLIWAGLNYQIEHHLFPRMSRFHLRSAGAEVQAWCRDEGIPYTQAGPLEAWLDVLEALHDVGKGLRSGAHVSYPDERRASTPS